MDATIKKMRDAHIKWNPWLEWAQNEQGQDLSSLEIYWGVCGKCGGKISRLNHNEQAHGYHNRCMTSESLWLAPLRLYAHDGQLEIKLVGKD